MLAGHERYIGLLDLYIQRHTCIYVYTKAHGVTQENVEGSGEPPADLPFTGPPGIA